MVLLAGSAILLLQAKGVAHRTQMLTYGAEHGTGAESTYAPSLGLFAFVMGF